MYNTDDELISLEKDTAVSKLDEAIAVIRAGEIEQGRRLLIEVLQEEPRNAQAWLWMSGVVSDPERRRQSLLAVLEIDPDNELAKKGLAKFGWAEEEIEPVAEYEPVVPAADERFPEPEVWEETAEVAEVPAGETIPEQVPEPELELWEETAEIAEVPADETIPEPEFEPELGPGLTEETPEVAGPSAVAVAPLSPEPRQPAVRWGRVVLVSIVLLILLALAAVVIPLLL